MVSEELKSKLQQITQQEIYKVIVSKPSDKAAKYRKIEIEKKIVRFTRQPLISQKTGFFMKR